MAGYNRITLVGYLTRDPELKVSVNGHRFARTALAVDRFKKHGSYQTADFFNLVAFKETAERIGKYCSKGSRVLVEGPLELTVHKDGPESKPIVWHNVIVNRVLFLGHPAARDEKPEQREESPDERPVSRNAVTSQDPRPPRGETARVTSRTRRSSRSPVEEDEDD